MTPGKWTPISVLELYDFIHRAEARMYGECWNLWKLIRIDPVKWDEPGYGGEGGGFWVVGICGGHAIWYNDIEGGFTISPYTVYGQIGVYNGNQDELDSCVLQLLELIRSGRSISG